MLQSPVNNPGLQLVKLWVWLRSPIKPTWTVSLYHGGGLERKERQEAGRQGTLSSSSEGSPVRVAPDLTSHHLFCVWVKKILR